MKRSLLVGFAIMVPLFLRAQEHSARIVSANEHQASASTQQGWVMSQHEVVSGALVQNKRSYEQIRSDIHGQFAIQAAKGDTLVTSLLNYKMDTLVVGNQPYLSINLQKASTVLREVIIKDTKLSPLEKFRKNQQDYHDIYRKGNSSDMVTISSGIMGNGLRAGPGAGVGLSIDAIYSALSK
ncbi:hypothetical protein HH214_15875 [Mucilaginibacter robiniae]|uniref:Uncharacterized protein n=1 Tax=Mucilaginibacter robiniae TaxID=2728022 RepID=A0A7L5E2I3_9SPHI|nr:hypothetical protein [Mucilaginibacter robiniae]QJD97241.1 hypothetical protein HH214_15875 [Mucilaginibacter robiniae]